MASRSCLQQASVYRQEKHLCAKQQNRLGQAAAVWLRELFLCRFIECSGVGANSWALLPGHVTHGILEVPPTSAFSSLSVNLPLLHASPWLSVQGRRNPGCSCLLWEKSSSSASLRCKVQQHQRQGSAWGSSRQFWTLSRVLGIR